MNLNGKKKNGTLGAITACREQIAVVQQRGHVSEAAAWLLERVDPEQNAASIISFTASVEYWAASLSKDIREKWLMWALKERPDIVRDWLGYNSSDWSLVPAPCKGAEGTVRLANKNGVPQLYLVPGEPRDKDAAGPVEIGGYKLNGIVLKTVTYTEFGGKWYKAYKAKLPCDSAINRAMRLFITGTLVGRDVKSTKDLWVYELEALKSWALYGQEGERAGLVGAPASAMEHLIIDPSLGKLGIDTAQ